MGAYSCSFGTKTDKSPDCLVCGSAGAVGEADQRPRIAARPTAICCRSWRPAGGCCELQARSSAEDRDALVYSHFIQGLDDADGLSSDRFSAQDRFPDARRSAEARAGDARALAGDGPLPAAARGVARAARSSSCMTGRPTPTATSISATRSTRSSRTSSTARSRCSARTRPTCRAGTATACRSSGSIEEKYRAKRPVEGQRADRPVPPRMPRVRRRTGSSVQSDEFKRLGVVGDWDNPYTTMAYSAEAQIVREIGKFLVNGGLYKGAKPVLWSVVEQTALAEAEVEYHDHRSTTVWVRFPMVTREPAGARRRARGDLDDDAVDHAGQPRDRLQRRPRICGRSGSIAVGEGSRARVGETPARRGAADRGVRRRGRHRGAYGRRRAFPGAALAGTVARHPLRGQGYDFDVPLLAADFVEADQGTGLVHIAPGHGADDCELGQAQRPAGARHGRARRRLSRRRAAVRRRIGLPARRQAGRRQRGGDRGDRGGRRAAGARHAGPLLSAFLAVEGAADLPQHAAMVHRAWRRTACARRRWRRSTRRAGSRRRAATASTR